MAAQTAAGANASRWHDNVTTIGVDIGGSGVKASLLDKDGNMLAERVRVDTPYPCPPERLVQTIRHVVDQLPPGDRMSVGFPGLVRDGEVYKIASLSRATYDGGEDPGLAARWRRFQLADALAAEFDVPVKVINDADMQGCAVATGEGFEFVMTLGTGVGCALFYKGHLLPHLEIPHGPFRDGMSFDTALGNVNRKKIGKIVWRQWVSEAIQAFDEMLFYDSILIGGGNAKKLKPQDLPDKVTIVPNSAGITGGVRVWDLAD